MHVNGYEKMRRDACMVLCAVTLWVTGCVPSSGRGRLVSLDLREAMRGQEVGGGRGVTALSESSGAFAGQMSRRLTVSRPGAGSPPERKPIREQKTERRITVQVLNTPIRAFFESLVSQDPGISMIVHPDVEGEVSVELKGVSVDEAVELVCEMHQLDCHAFAGRGQDGRARGYKIFPWQLTTRTYPVDFLSVVRDGYSQTTVSSGNRQDVVTTRTDKDKSKNTTATQHTPGSGMRTEYKSDFWTDLENTITSILQLGLVISKMTEETDEQGRTSRSVTRERKNAHKFGTVAETQIRFKKKGVQIETSPGRAPKEKPGESTPPDEEPAAELLPAEKGVVINRQAGLITVRAYPREHQEIAGFLEQLRRRSQRQVILEAKILEVILNDGAQFGIDWLAVNRGIGSSMPPLSSEPQGGGTFTSLAVPDPTSGSGGTTSFFTKGVLLSRASGLDQPINMAVRAHDFVGFVHLLQQQGTVQVLSSPRVATVNNQKAVIKVGSDEFFFTGMQPGSVVGSGNDRVVNPTTLSMESMFTGISLDVTPQVGEGEVITLHVHPMVTEVQDKVKSFVLDDKPHSVPMAFTQTRETDSIIRVRNGEMAVIGGLMKNRSREQEDRLPWLGELPVVGGLFGHQDKKWEKSELVILLRPVVVDGQQAWDDQVERAAGRMDAMVRIPLPARTGQ